MTVDEFRELYISERPIYKALGEYVTERITNKLLESHKSIYDILQIDPKPRVKEVGSLIIKAYQRGKDYADPYNDITDKVGTRFVVLIKAQVKEVDDIIESFVDVWSFRKDRDSISEKLKSPELFIYQSDHYIVRPIRDIEYCGTMIPAGTPCEIQVRTILQHAYSQMSHDFVYKPKVTATNNTRRCLAKSMALMETTDDIFDQAHDDVGKNMREEQKILDYLYNLYKNNVGTTKIIPRIDSAFIDDFFSEDLFDELKDFYKEGEGSRYFSLIGDVSKEFEIFKQPSILLLVYLLIRKRQNTIDKWAYSEDLLEKICSYLGISYEHFS
jgi:ppGpp synthetase/RelA/SpoT-type nucleotidyltranferase